MSTSYEQQAGRVHRLDAKKLNAAIKDAVAQLKKSERGTQVLRDLKALLANGAYGLDSKNMTAMCVLVESVRVGMRDTIDTELADL